MARTEANPFLSRKNVVDDDESGLSFTETLTTNATADNLPGPGRNLGNLYNRLGLTLEKRVNSIAWKLSQRRIPKEPIPILENGNITVVTDSESLDQG